MSSQIGNDRSQTEILINATVQALLIALKRELDDGASRAELHDIIDGLLYYAQGKRVQ